MLLHQARRHSVNTFHVRSYTTTLFIALSCVILASNARAEYFIPTSFGGSLSYGYGYSRIADSEAEGTTTTLSLNGGGYIWEPWFMTLGAGVGLGVSSSKSNGVAGNSGKSVSGSMDFTLFPQSRFPTNFGFSVNDSRQELKDNLLLPGMESQSRRFYVRQTYNSLGGMNINGWFDQSMSSSSSQPGEAVDRSIGFQIRKRFAYNDFQLGGGMIENDPADSDIKAINSNLMLTHNYTPSAEVGLSSSASYSNAKSTGGISDGFSSTYDQVSSSFYWRPEHRPYYVSAGVLVYSVDSGAVSRGVSTSANASYQLARNINVNAGLSVSVSDAGGNQTINTSQSLSTSIPSDQYTIFGFDYGWNVGLGWNANEQRSDVATKTVDGAAGKTQQTQQSVSVSASHRLGRSWNLGRNTSTNLNFGQSAAMSKSSSSDEPTSSVANSVSAGWNNYAFGGNTSAGASSSYSRSFGKDGAAFLVASAQLARNQELSRLSQLSGSINFQASRAEQPSNSVSNGGEPAKAENAITKSASANFSYSHSRFLGVYGLIYNSALAIPTLLKEDGKQSTATKDWDNSLVYRIGLLALNLTARVSETGPGLRAYSMSFSAVRSF